jgi:hypothetical protein
MQGVRRKGRKETDPTPLELVLLSEGDIQRRVKSIRVTPAMTAGSTERILERGARIAQRKISIL